MGKSPKRRLINRDKTQEEAVDTFLRSIVEEVLWVDAAGDIEFSELDEDNAEIIIEYARELLDHID